MTVVDVGINRIRDVVATDLQHGVAGSSTSAITYSTTALGSPVAAAEGDVSYSLGQFAIQIVHNIPSNVGDGMVFREYGTYMNAGGTLLHAFNAADLVKTTSIEIERVTLFHMVRDE